MNCKCMSYNLLNRNSFNCKSGLKENEKLGIRKTHHLQPLED